MAGDVLMVRDVGDLDMRAHPGAVGGPRRNGRNRHD